MTKQSDYDAEIARLDTLKDTGHELDDATRVDAVMAKMPRDVFSLRISSEELTEVAAAARARGQNLGEFIRNAALHEARTGATQESRRWLEAPVAAALDELVKRVEEQDRGQKRRRRPSAAGR